MSQSFILINYEINKEEVAQKYCVNKDKPQMHCCGKCMLKKKLAQQEEQQKFPSFPDIKTDFSLIHKRYNAINVGEIPFTVCNELHTFFPQFKDGCVFHPPSFA